MSVKRKDLLTIWAILDSLRAVKTNVRTAFTIAKNRNLIQPEIDALKESLKLDDDQKVYEDKRIELCNEFSLKDDSGKPLVDGGNFLFSEEGRELFEEAIKKLQEEMPDVTKTIIEQEKSMQSLLDEDVSVQLQPFDLNQLPDNLLSVAQLEVLDRYDMIVS